jgi:hypothetical protein
MGRTGVDPRGLVKLLKKRGLGHLGPDAIPESERNASGKTPPVTGRWTTQANGSQFQDNGSSRDRNSR